jgi:hypothetical protein
MLLEFLQAVEEGAPAPVVDGAPTADDDVHRWLRERHARSILELPGPALGHDAAAAVWGACRLYSGCRFLTFRKDGPEAVTKAFAGPTPTATPEAIFAVDLALRHLPELWRLADELPDDDVLIVELRRLASTCPLSSIGVPNVADVDLAPIFAHAGLRRLYIDRVLQRRDLARLRHPLVLAGAREAVGAQPELQPLLAGL